MARPWSPSSWRGFPAAQQPVWPDAARAEIARGELRGMPPLVFAGEARALQDSLAEVAAGRRFYPPADRVFNALALTPFDDVRVVILGQDPYHGAGQAMGLCFSVPAGVRPPPSLQNIHQELETDLRLPRPATGDLTPWAERGVLLLNAVLTVSPGKPASHASRGWERFTDRVIAELSTRREGIVFLLWGRYAQQKGAVVDASRHHVLTASHPSPYSAASGFFGCRHFSRANALLTADGRPAVDWGLS